MRYLAGFGVHAQEGVGQSPPAVRFLHGDLIRSTMLTTDETGSAGVSPAVAYTAFGEPVTPDGQGGWRIGFPPGAGGIGEPLGTRYQYAGGWGYETGPWGPGPGGQGGGGGLDVNGGLTLYGGNADLPPITLQHVGWRWYQPSAGRFIQRDPMGIRGGLNVYAYGVNNPLARVDAWGLAAEPPTTQEARGALRELVDAVVDAVTWGVRGTVRTMYNFCVLWVWVQEQNKRVFRPPAPPPLPPPPNPGGWIGPRPEGPPETPPIGPPPPPLRIY
jgi:RHS repeat-associated protein